MSTAQWTLSVQDFRGLRNVRWSPSGVCLLAGPNGAGKSSILDALEFLRTASIRGVAEAVRLAGGGALLKRKGAEPKAPVRIGLSLGELSWEIQLPVEGGGIDPNHGELIKYGDRILAQREMHATDVLLHQAQTEWPEDLAAEVKANLRGKHDERRAADERSTLQMLWDMNRPPEVEPTVSLVRGIHVHKTYPLDEIRDPQSGVDTDADLHPRGKNVWNVLRNWKTSPRRFHDQFQWVLGALKDAFPDLVFDLEFESIARTVIGLFYPPGARGADDGLPLSLAPDGLLAGILHLTAVAGAKEGSILALDEMDNYLHPHAIRSILKAMREMADERDLTIILTTHSPVVMNEFKGHEDQFYVLEAGRDRLPIPLDEAQDPDWLAHFSLGDLYDREEFAAPQRPSPSNAAE